MKTRHAVVEVWAIVRASAPNKAASLIAKYFIVIVPPFRNNIC